MLHVTNGDAAAGKILRMRVGDQVVPWRDALHEGPVPDGLSDAELLEARTRFIGERGWEDIGLARARMQWRDATLAEAPQHGEVVLWFEHDLCDQLQLIQVLDRLARDEGGRPRVSLIVVEDYLGPMDPDRLRDLFPKRVPVTDPQLELACEAWAAFRAPDPTAIVRLLEGDTSALPFLAGALRRHLQQFPSVKNGLSRSESQILEALADGPRTLKDAFVASHGEREEALFLGDVIWLGYVAELGAGAEPLVTLDDGSPIVVPRRAQEAGELWPRSACITEAGRATLEGRRDRVRTAGIDRWLGGVHLEGREARWRWDEAARTLRAADP